MDPVLAAALGAASDDVRDTLTWLDDMGFQLASSRCGRHESFGDTLLLFTGPVDVKIIRDRGQWDMTVRPNNDASYYSLAVLLAAYEGTALESASAGASDMPAQLPPGVAWREVLPTVIEWLGKPGALAAARAVNARSSEVLRQRLRGSA